MLKKSIAFGIVALSAAMLFSCTKNGTNVGSAQYQIGTAVSDSAALKGSIRGTMISGKTYTIGGDVTVQKGDTLYLQSGVTVDVGSGYNIIVKGVLISEGTKDQPNYFTVSGAVKTDTKAYDLNTDVAYKGSWGGILCDTTCNLMVIKYTHIEFTGASLVNPPVYGTSAGSSAWALFFQNATGQLVVEDSWIYGTVVDAIRVNGGKVSIMRNTFSKIGKLGAEGVNIKGSTTGDLAYNLIMGCGQNGLKASNYGATTIQCNVNMYNNTILNSGWKTNQIGRGGSINFEEGAKGMAYNNLIVNCRFGLRVVKSPPADTANLKYGYNYYYGDKDTVVNEFYPVGYLSAPMTTDYPNPATYLPSDYTPGAAYSKTGLAGANNPLFVNYSLPVTGNFQDISYVSGFDFHLQSASPAVGKGYTGFSAIAAVTKDASFGATEITQPGVDMGAYQRNGSGNQH
ncbi:hypothetical protein [Chitinophaga sancti]|uniref:hypothetical protein n=1 Tax=Chitinophaga sancti TaxID=1004 RepID=UPI003F78BEED